MKKPCRSPSIPLLGASFFLALFLPCACFNPIGPMLQEIAAQPDVNAPQICITRDALAVTGDALEVGEANLGTPKDIVLAVANTGKTDLILSELPSLTETEPASFSIVSALAALSVPAGSSAEFTLRFTPTAMGRKTAELKVLSNDPTRARLALTVGGSGIPVGTVAAPDFSPPSGTYTAEQGVTICSATPGAAVIYTTDGSDPSTANGSVFTAALEVPLRTSVTIKAFAVKADWADSTVSTAAYTVTGAVADPTCTPSGLSGGVYSMSPAITLSSATADSWIFYTTDGNDPSHDEAGSALGTSVKMASGGTVAAGSFTGLGAKTLKALAWSPAYTDSGILSVSFTVNGFAVTFDKNDADAAGTMSTQRIAYGSAAALSPCGFSKSGWVFTGWATTADGTVTYEDQASYAMGCADAVLYAKWDWGSYGLRSTGPAGGLICYVNPNAAADGWKYLEASPASTESASVQWGAYGTGVGASGTGINTGQSNTTVIVSALIGLGESGRAAQLCDALTCNGFTDWFLPSQEELNQAYVNLRTQGVGGFASAWYWTSTEFDGGAAWLQSFADGNQNDGSKNTVSADYRVRAVRSF